LLQPIEELQSCKAKAKESIDLNYNSLPPQLVVLKALRAKHFVLATVCVMALLTNLLAIAFAGLFFQETIDMRHPTILTSPYQFKFVHINGSIGPGGSNSPEESSGAWRGGNGKDQFLVAESNLTRKTPLPAWTDHSMFYVPLFSEGSRVASDDTHFEADAKAFGAELDCVNLEVNGTNFQLDINRPDPMRYSYLDMKLNIQRESRKISCIGSVIYSPPGQGTTPCLTGPSAAEMYTPLQPSAANGTTEDAEICRKSIVFGWARTPNSWCDGSPRPLNQENSIFLHCIPRLKRGKATILVDAAGRLQNAVKNLSLDVETGKWMARIPLTEYSQTQKERKY
jgi:hypothetical protein